MRVILDSYQLSHDWCLYYQNIKSSSLVIKLKMFCISKVRMCKSDEPMLSVI